MRRLIIVAMVGLVWAGLAAPALAEHTHARMTGNGSCVILAANGGEKDVQLPHADDFAESKRHPLHLNVHQGQPGVVQGEAVIWVLGEVSHENCDGYVNE